MLLSILNVVVDHVMLPPSPMEPAEFREVCRWKQNKNDSSQNKDGSGSMGGGMFSLAPQGGGDPSSDTQVDGDAQDEYDALLAPPSVLASDDIYIKVPVLRVFGPVLREGNQDEFIKQSQSEDEVSVSQQSSDSQQSTLRRPKRRIPQPQSGCLHIHGAFPYLLARPLIAGPDGSMHHGHNCDDDSMRVNWDDANSVSNILEEIHIRLEMTLRTSFEHHSTDRSIPGVNMSGGGASLEEKKKKSIPLFIRQVTIVTGRGFYTYCSGPPAPFLRVEYYDPSHRWRVKMALERGLELNEMYHPDPIRYDYTNEDLRNEGHFVCHGAEDSQPLKFRCYEAHIPYTMQVFKDCNLAGMKYIKVGGVRFRSPLPRSLRRRTKDEFSEGKTFEGTQANGMADDLFFLSHTVSSDLVWPQLEVVSVESRAQIDEHWLLKTTSCDLEFDSTVNQLLNVLDVMTELPSPIEERQKIHWRAVPSLKEVWEQERKRMSILLPPENDFLTCMEKEERESECSESSSSDSDDDDEGRHVNQIPQFTLEVKKGASVPGTRLAVKGVKRLFRTSDGLEADFRRALKEIVDKHETFIDQIDQDIKKGIVETRPLFEVVEEPIDCSSSDPLGEGIEALAALGDQFTQRERGDSEDDGSSSPPIKLSSRSDPKTPIIKKLLRGQIFTNAGLSQRDVEEEVEMLTFGARIDADQVAYSDDSNERGLDFSLQEDGDSSEDGEGFLDEEEELGEKGFERALTQLATQSEFLGGEECVESFAGGEVLPTHQQVDDHHSEQDLFSDDDLSQQGKPFDDNLFAPNLSQPSEDSAPSESGRSEASAPSFTEDQQPQPQPHPLSRSEIFAEPIAQSSSLTWSNIKAESNPLHPLPGTPLQSNPNWFGFRYKECEVFSTELPPGTFVEPVQRPPSYSRVKSWMRTNVTSMNRESSQQKVDPKGQETDGQAAPPAAYLTAFTQMSQHDCEENYSDPLAGIGNQGGQIQISNGASMKTLLNASTTFTPLTIMSIEVHVQCRIKPSMKDNKEMAMVPDSSRDCIFAVVYVYRDPGGGESLEILEKGCILVTIEKKGRASDGSSSVPKVSKAAMGISSGTVIEKASSERSLLLRFASIVKLKDPDCLMSWDTLGLGIGYIVERGVALGKPGTDHNGVNASSQTVDMARLLGRTPKSVPSANMSQNAGPLDMLKGEDSHVDLKGSGLGAEWDDRVGAGVAASSISGRIVLCGWKICSTECKHPNASYQPAIVSSIMNKRMPHHDDLILTKWYGMNNGAQRWRVIEYRMLQAMANILLFDALDVLGRAGEAARLSGVEFSQSLPGIRGSQYKVEGVLLRALQSVQSNERGEKRGLSNDSRGLANTSLTATNSQTQHSKSQPETQTQSPWKLRRLRPRHNESSHDMGYFFFSPSKIDCTKQEALECQAMTLEPQSGFYFDPVVVCDFTALYPSLVIAYNLCYTTLAGKLDYHSTRAEMRREGKTTGKVGPFFYSERRTAATIRHHMKTLSVPSSQGKKRKRDRAYVIPTGSVFVSESVLKGVLPQVLDEMLSTRAMLKKAAKEYKKRVPALSPAVLRQIEARQLALKYVANVTYGYTSATFSGRSAVPLVADAIVEMGRRTLTNAINLANRWGQVRGGRWAGAKVLYGDTDSVFIKLPGRSVEEAFEFGEEYCKAVTASNPPPINLKLEKVYGASLLQTKKKYCGMMYESPKQKVPIFEAKGIETIRRDQCAITQRVLRQALIQVFNCGLSSARQYLFRQWSLIHRGGLPVSDFVLTGRVRSRYRGGKSGPVQACLAKRLAEVDPGKSIRHKERLPYVIFATPGRAFKLKDNVLTPLELLEQWDSFSIHSEYYAVKHVNAALQRCFGLAPFNVNIEAWYRACPKPRRRIHHWPHSRSSGASMISTYFGSDICAICGDKTRAAGSSKVVICLKCRNDGVSVACTAIEKLKITQQRANELGRTCSTCNGCVENSVTFAQEENRARKSISPIRALANSNRKIKRLVTPIANCTCIDCPITYERHRMRENEIEALELCDALDIY